MLGSFFKWLISQACSFSSGGLAALGAVAKGLSVSIIARKDAISRKRIMRATNECSDALQPGQTLRVSALP
ncbi:hypothetical protein IE4872_PC00305 (plasmid) [Rhizobium gallicum]|uniref:Uncharacterized protein n=1 Tax=Rhizobium gallicum TaxID=56730 RepID=A0A1L5NR35_9HYPH|nr:hypothetical protein IE4872_PC00305 [Rhizobium gallicum]